MGSEMCIRDRYVSADDTLTVLQDYEGEKGASVLLPEAGSVVWSVSIEEAGMYNLQFLYYPYEGGGSSILRNIRLDDVIPFQESAEVSFERIWINQSSASTQTDIKGNEIRPKQVEKPAWTTKMAMDSAGYYTGPLYYYLEAGEHTIALEAVREPMLLRRMVFLQYEKPQSYQELKEEYAQKGYRSASKTIPLEAEDATAKSDQTMFPLADRTSPSVSPYHSSLIRYNTIGGAQWKTAGQWLEWDVYVEESGLYNIAAHFKQSLKTNDVSIRELYIDGRLPFAEAASLSFRFDNGWQTGAFGDDEGNRYQFFLKAGRHTIRLRVGMGESSDVLKRVRGYMDDLNRLYRKIVVVTGTNPDMYRDYHFDVLIPDVIAEMKSLCAELRALEKDIKALNSMGGQSTAAIKRLYIQMGGMTDDVETIAYRLKTFKDNISSYGTWMNGLIEQPLELDTILLTPVDAALPRGEAGVFGLIKHYLVQFFASFTSDYASIGEMETGADTTIRVWTTAGRDQAQVLKQIINDTFTPQSGVAVNLQLVNQGSLLPAVLARIGPDVSLAQQQADPLNFALRHAVKDLSGFEGFEETIDQFYESALEPFRFDNRLYALPETQVFPMLFYRKDILNELGISLQDLETWDSILMSVLPKIQKSCLMVGITPNINTYLTFLYQMGGTLYTEDGKASGLNTPQGINAMRLQSSLYTQYGLPLAYDFANRFRTGEMPLAVADYTAYNQLTVFAPEIKGLWGMLPVPGTRGEDGTVSHAAVGIVTGCVMLSQTEYEDASWDFMQWWTSADTQTTYGKELESVVGSAARYNSANRVSMEQVQWLSLIHI